MVKCSFAELWWAWASDVTQYRSCHNSYYRTRCSWLSSRWRHHHYNKPQSSSLERIEIAQQWGRISNQGWWNAVLDIADKERFLSLLKLTNWAILRMMTHLIGAHRQRIGIESCRWCHQESAFQVIVDSINSVGGNILPELLKSLGVEYVSEWSGKWWFCP